MNVHVSYLEVKFSIPTYRSGQASYSVTLEGYNGDGHISAPAHTPEGN